MEIIKREDIEALKLNIIHHQKRLEEATTDREQSDARHDIAVNRDIIARLALEILEEHPDVLDKDELQKLTAPRINPPPKGAGHKSNGSVQAKRIRNDIKRL
jgi:hypothetical protein